LLISDLRRVLHAGNHTLAHLEIERAQRIPLGKKRCRPGGASKPRTGCANR
jgi:hypothetical protein